MATHNLFFIHNIINIQRISRKVKVKQSHYRTGPEGSRRLRLPDF
jgi:hypothetical protein